MKDIKVFEDENKTLYELFVQLFEEGYVPMSFEELLEFQNENNNTYDTNIAKVDKKNIIIKTFNELEFVKKGDGRLLWLGSLDCNLFFAIGSVDFCINIGGRLVGVKRK